MSAVLLCNNAIMDKTEHSYNGNFVVQQLPVFQTNKIEELIKDIGVAIVQNKNASPENAVI